MSNAPQIFDLRPRVLVVDNNERTRKWFAKLVEKWGYRPILAEGQGGGLLQNARDQVRAARCQLALVDMRLVDDLDEDDTSGLKLVQDLKPASSIVVSASGDPVDARDSIELGAASFVSKDEDPEVLRAKLQKEADRWCANCKKIQIGPADILEQISASLCSEFPEEYHDQILDVLMNLFPDAHSLRLAKLGFDPQTAQISSAPRPKSVVLKVYEDGEPHPKIIKLARIYKIQRELIRYNQFIDGHLRGGHNPIWLSQSQLWDIGGAKFNYVGKSETSFANLWHTESLENIQLILTRFFTDFWVEHYNEKKPVENISLYQLYCDVWGPEWIERVRKMLASDFGKNLTLKHDPPLALINPLQWLLDKIVESPDEDASRIARTFTAVTHGDLHGDNLLVDQDHNAWVIDFERSGVGHILQDFTELESDIINRMKCDEENFGSYFRLCFAVAGPTDISAIEKNPQIRNPEFAKALEVITILRSLAEQCTGVSDAREYILGLLFNTVFRATIIKPERADCRKRILMLASILCHRLEHWDEPWPPKEWQQLS
jgi:CheY-like chemotaxis protein